MEIVMESTEKPGSVAGAASMFEWVTITHLVFIALFAAGAIAMLVWGGRLYRERRRSERERERRETGDEPPPA
jgi:hypothetical protein